MNFSVRKLESRSIVRHYLCDPTFSRFDTIPECDRHTHTHRDTTTAYDALSVASHGKHVVNIMNINSILVKSTS